MTDLIPLENVDQEVIPPSALAVIESASIDMQIATAHKYPRSLSRFRNNALAMATADSDTAAECFYVLPRAGKQIEGPSIRLAEIVACAWGNLRMGTRIIEVSDKFVVAQGICHDLETNVAVSVETRRRITNSQGQRYNDDMITTTANAACSTSLRNAVFRIIPGALVKQIVDAAKKVAVGDATTFAKKRQDVIALFAKMGVDAARLEAHLGCKPDDMTPDQFADLRGAFNAIKDGQSTVDDLFPPPPKPELAADAEQKPTGPPTGRKKVTRKAAAPKPPEEAPEPPPEEPPAPSLNEQIVTAFGQLGVDKSALDAYLDGDSLEADDDQKNLLKDAFDRLQNGEAWDEIIALPEEEDTDAEA